MEQHFWALPALCRSTQVKIQLSTRGQSRGPGREGPLCSQWEVTGDLYCVTQPAGKSGCLDHRYRNEASTCAMHTHAGSVCSLAGHTLGRNADAHIPSVQLCAASVGLICWLNESMWMRRGTSSPNCVDGKPCCGH